MAHRYPFYQIEASGAVETASWFIQKQQAWVSHHFHAHVDSLPLPTADATRCFVTNATVAHVVQL